MSRLLCSLAALVVAQVFLILPVFAQEKKFVKPVNQWSGELEDVAAGIGETQIITNSQALAKWWKEAAAPGKIPEPDFSKNVVVIVFSRGSVLDMKATLEAGNLSVFALSSKDSPPGLRYTVGEFSREGVKKVNNKELK